MRCFIFGALDSREPFVLPRSGDLVIAADKGYEQLKRLKTVPDKIIGDFDSLGYIPTDENTTVLPVRKDDTDLGYAVKTGLSAGADEFYIYGAVGGRLDLTLASLQLSLALAKRNIPAVFFGEMSFTTVSPSVLVFPPTAAGRISVFAAEKSVCSIKGLSFPLENGILEPTFPLGVSNAFTGSPAEITVHSGIVTVMWEDNLIPKRFDLPCISDN